MFYLREHPCSLSLENVVPGWRAHQTENSRVAISILMADLEWYRSFVHVYRSGTVSSAARGLHLTQPAVSQHLSALESALGYRLFVRTPRRMQPTDLGKALYDRVADSVARLELVTTEPNTELERLRLGAPHEFFAARVVERLARLGALSVAATLGPSAWLIQQVQNGDLDAAISTLKRPHPELSYRSIFEETFWLVAPPSARVPSRRLLEAWLCGAPWIAYDPDLPILRRFFRQVFGHRLDVSLRLSVPDLRAVLRAVECGLGVSILPDYLCAEAVARDRVALVLSPKEPVTNDLWLVTPRQGPRADATRGLQEALSDLRGASHED